MARKRRDDNSPGAVNTIFEKAAPTLSKALEPKSETEQSDLRIRLANAGFSSPNAPQNFLAIKLIGLFLGVMFGAVYGFANMGVSENSWMAFVIGGGIGFYLPAVVLTLMKMSRQQKIFLQLPDALDLLVVCVEAGLGLDAGLRRVSDELASAAPEVCQELANANMQLQMGRPRREVLRDLGIRTGGRRHASAGCNSDSGGPLRIVHRSGAEGSVRTVCGRRDARWRKKRLRGRP